MQTRATCGTMRDRMLPARPEYLPLDAVRAADDVLAAVVFGEAPDLQHVLTVSLPIPQRMMRIESMCELSGDIVGSVKWLRAEGQELRAKSENVGDV